MSMAENIGKLMTQVTYKEIRRALRDAGGKISPDHPCGEPQLRTVLEKLIPVNQGHLGALSSLCCAVIRAAGGAEDMWWDSGLLLCALCEEARADPVQLISDMCDLQGNYRISCKALTAVIAALDPKSDLGGMTHALWAMADAQGSMPDDRLMRWDGLKLLRSAVGKRLAAISDQVQMMTQRLASAYNPPLRIAYTTNSRLAAKESDSTWQASGWSSAQNSKGGQSSGFKGSSSPWQQLSQVKYESLRGRLKAHKASASGVLTALELTQFVSTLVGVGGKEAADTAAHLRKLVVQARLLTASESVSTIPWPAVAVALSVIALQGKEKKKMGEITLELLYFLCGSPPGSDEYLVRDILYLGDLLGGIPQTEKDALQHASQHNVVGEPELEKWTGKDGILTQVNVAIESLHKGISTLRSTSATVDPSGHTATEWTGYRDLTVRRVQDAYTGAPWRSETKSLDATAFGDILRSLGAPMSTGNAESLLFRDSLFELFTERSMEEKAGAGLHWLEATMGILCIARGRKEEKAEAIWEMANVDIGSLQGSSPSLTLLEKAWNFVAPKAQKKMVRDWLKEASRGQPRLSHSEFLRWKGSDSVLVWIEGMGLLRASPKPPKPGGLSNPKTLKP